MTDSSSPKRGTDPARVVVSNGFSKFNMDHSAEELARVGRLERYLTGAYPTQFWRRLFARGAPQGAIGRFLARATRIPDSSIDSIAFPEMLHFLAMALPPSTKTPGGIGEYFDIRSLQLYGDAAARAVARVSTAARVYHYRSGFGGRSLAVARANGMALLCEHSIVHPKAADYVVAHGGRLPDARNLPAMSRFWQHLSDDIAPCDLVVVNSDFVKTSFVAMGHAPQNVIVLYRGIDDEFLALLDSAAPRTVSDGPLRLLFAGAFGTRKGAHCLRDAFAALKDVADWSLTLAGPVEPECRDAFAQLTADPRVRVLGSLPRAALASAMRQADVFVFPTLAEGSARVVFEALAAGCYVVTTANSGSIVGAGAEGVLVAPEDSTQLAQSISTLIGARGRVADGGAANARLIRAQYTQRMYGEKLLALYDIAAASAKGRL